MPEAAGPSSPSSQHSSVHHLWASDTQFESTPHLSKTNRHIHASALKLVVHNSQCDILLRSNMLPRDCDGDRLDDNEYVPLLLTTTGRSGTDFAQGLLHNLGLVSLHDNAESTVAASGLGPHVRAWPNHTDVVVSWPHAFADGAVPGCRTRAFGNVRDDRRFRHVAHLIREPLASINSRYNRGHIEAFQARSSCFTTASVGHDRSSKLALTLKHYVLWNSFVEASARFHVPLERLDGPWLRALLTFGGLPIRHTDDEMQRAIVALKAKHVNSGHTKKMADGISWEALRKADAQFAVLAQLLALRHGYELRDEELIFSRNASSMPQQHCGFERIQNSNALGRWDCWLAWERVTPASQSESAAEVPSAR